MIGTQLIAQHYGEDRTPLDTDTPVPFARTTVRMRAVQNLSTVYPCIAAADDIEITVESKREVDPFGRGEMIGRAWAFCGAPDTCPWAREARL